MSTNWYDAADWYDIAFGWDAGDEIAALERIFAEFAPRRVRRVYEPFCGCGRLTIPLARAGFDVIGADLNPAMIDLALRKAETEAISVEHHVADVRLWTPTAPIDAVVTLIDSFRHITDAGDVRALLARWAGLVGPGGVIVIGLDLDDPGGASCPPSEWTAARGGVEVHTRVETSPIPRAGSRADARPHDDQAPRRLHAIDREHASDAPVHAGFIPAARRRSCARRAPRHQLDRPCRRQTGQPWPSRRYLDGAMSESTATGDS